MSSGEELLTQTGNIVGRWIEQTEKFLNQTHMSSMEEAEAEDLGKEEIADIVLYELVIRIACFLMPHSLVWCLFLYMFEIKISINQTFSAKG